MSDSTYRILMVCTGNICRSPFMERLMQARIIAALPPADVPRFEIESCGTWGMSDHAMEPTAAETLIAAGGDPDGFIARAMAASMIEAADLVLTATREHRGLVVTEVPRASSRTLTVREFARLLTPVTAAEITAAVGTDPIARMREIARRAFGNRGLVPLADPADDDVGDPYGRARAVYERVAAEIDAALAVPLGLLLTA